MHLLCATEHRRTFHLRAPLAAHDGNCSIEYQHAKQYWSAKLARQYAASIKYQRKHWNENDKLMLGWHQSSCSNAHRSRSTTIFTGGCRNTQIGHKCRLHCTAALVCTTDQQHPTTKINEKMHFKHPREPFRYHHSFYSCTAPRFIIITHIYIHSNVQRAHTQTQWKLTNIWKGFNTHRTK